MTSLIISSWNIQGLNASAFGSKPNDPDFKERLKNIDIQILLETWTRAEDESLAPMGYKEFSISAQKSKTTKLGRRSGGILIWYKEELKEHVKAIKRGDNHIWMKISSSILSCQYDIYLCAAYIPPPESPYCNPDIYEVLQRETAHFQSRGRVLICGDLSARTGTEKDYLTSDGNTYILGGEAHYLDSIQTIRNSYDRVVNKSGKALLNLCRSLGLYIMNGRIRGDSLGRFTLNSHVGSSVVDYAITDADPADINAFIVTPETHLSDHNQILLHMRSTDKPATQQPYQSGLYNLPPSFKWVSQSASEYTNATNRPEIKELLTNFYMSFYESDQQGVTQAVKDFNNILYTMAELAGLKQTNLKRPNNKQSHKWFDSDCKALRHFLRVASNQKHRDPNNRDAREAYDTLRRRCQSISGTVCC